MERARVWDAAQGSAEARAGGGGRTWSLQSCSLGPTPESSPDMGQQSHQPGYLPQGQISPSLLPGQGFLLASLRQQQIWEKSVSFLLGKVENQGSPVAMVATDHPRCNIMSSSSASRCVAAGKQSDSPRCEHDMAGHTHCPLCSHSLPWDAGCALGCTFPSVSLSRTLPGSKNPISESSAGEGEAWHLHRAMHAGV